MADLPAGRELDALVAEKVFGKVFPPNGRYLDEPGHLRYAGGVPGFNHLVNDVLPKYSTDIAAAWEVVERLTAEWGWWDMEFGWRTISEVERNEKGWTNWCITLLGPDDDVEVFFKAGSAAHAICLAALKAVNG